MRELKATDKITQKMTRDGAVSENLATGEVKHISSREPETELSTSSEESAGAAADLALRVAERHERKAARKAEKVDTQAVQDGSAARRRPSSRLQFTEEERADPALGKYIDHSDRAADRLDAAKAAIPTKKVLRTERIFDETAGKGKTQLHFEEVEKRPNGRLRHNPLSRPVHEIAHAAHAKVHEVEQENVGVEAGHKGEVLAYLLGVLLFVFDLFGPLKALYGEATRLTVMNAALDRIEAVLDEPELSDNGKQHIPAQAQPGQPEVLFNDVTFAYQDKEVLHHISFAMKKNSMTALVGPSGSGKSTIANLLARLWDVKSGNVTIRGVDIRNVPLSELMDQISMVFQRVYLFQDTIYNNISMGKPDATEEEVYEAAKKARCYDFIIALPDGFQTVIGEGGATLSGGEKQRISIARCILKDAPIVILDEATASVDTDNESYIQEAISELVKGKTLLVIAHRLNTIRQADQILVIDNGQIAQQGTHLMLALLDIVQGVISTIMQAAGFGQPQSAVLPSEIVSAIEDCGFFESIPLWAVTLIGGLFIWVLSFQMILSVYGRFFKMFMYTAIAPIPLSTFAGEPTQSIGKSFLKSYASVCMEGAVIVLACVIFSAFASSPPVVDAGAAAATMVWSYIGELIFNMLILVGSVKMADRVVREMMGL